MSNVHRVAVVGYGNVGRYAVTAVQAAPDMELAGIVRRRPDEGRTINLDVPVVADVKELGRVDVALLCCPTRSVPDLAPVYLSAGINTVDSFDLHGEPIVKLRDDLDRLARNHGSVAIISAGWDPGTDSVIRALLEVMSPKGITFTNFGPGVSMGHTTVVKAMPGVDEALSLTIPAGTGVHRRLVYVKLAEGASFEAVEQAVLNDPYFKYDDTRVVAVDNIQDLMDLGHSVRIERKGVSGETHNQRFAYEMQIHNPALTAQVMVAAARASLKRAPGAYTLLEIPLIDMLPGDRDELVRRLV